MEWSAIGGEGRTVDEGEDLFGVDEVDGDAEVGLFLLHYGEEGFEDWRGIGGSGRVGFGLGGHFDGLVGRGDVNWRMR